MSANFGETLAYWYLRLNGFFPLTNFVLHKGAVSYSADFDLLAVRFPYVYEVVGGQEGDWDIANFRLWDIDLARDTVGLIVEVKTGANTRKLRENIVNSFSVDRLIYGIQRLGLWELNQVHHIAHELENQSIYRDPERNFVVGKLLIAANMPSENAIPAVPPCLKLHLGQLENFVFNRIDDYNNSKQGDKLRFPDDLMQYIVWSRRRNRR